MVTKYITIILMFVLFSSAVHGECTPYWICDDWSSCMMTGYNIRECKDLSECPVSVAPIEIKKCDDPENYEIINVEAYQENSEPSLVTKSPNESEIEPYLVDEEEKEEPINNVENKPDLYIGLMIIGVFILLGILIGRKIKK